MVWVMWQTLKNAAVELCYAWIRCLSVRAFTAWFGRFPWLRTCLLIAGLVAAASAFAPAGPAHGLRRAGATRAVSTGRPAVSKLNMKVSQSLTSTYAMTTLRVHKRHAGTFLDDLF